jgi:hypothetical protein
MQSELSTYVVKIGRKTHKVKAKTPFDATVSVLNRLGLRYIETDFTVMPLEKVR